MSKRKDKIRDDDLDREEGDERAIAPQQAPRIVAEYSEETVELAVPLARRVNPVNGEEYPYGYERSHVDFQCSAVHRRSLRRLFVALHASHATLQNGRHVDTQNHAMMWLLEQIDALSEVSEVSA